MRVGESRRLSLPTGVASMDGVVVELRADRSGLVTIEARSHDIDTLLKVTRSAADGGWAFVARDDDGGVATNSRLVIDVEREARYRLEVLPIHATWCPASVEIAAIEGYGAVPDADDAAPERDYWAAVEDKLKQQNDPVCDIEVMLRRSDSLIDRDPEERLRLAGEAHSRAEKNLSPDHQLLLADACQTLGEALHDAGEYERARPLQERAIAIREQRLGQHRDVATALTRLGWTLDELGENERALAAYERALAIHGAQVNPDRIEVADNLNNMGQCLIRLGRYGEARSRLERALREREETVGPGDPSLAEDYMGLGDSLFRIGDYARAEQLYLQAIDMLRKDPAVDPFTLGVACNDLGIISRRLGHYEDARRHLEEAVRNHERSGDREQLAIVLNVLGRLDTVMGLYDEALPHYNRAVGLMEKARGPQHHAVGEFLGNRAGLYLRQKRYEQARADLRQALDILRGKFDPEHPELARVLISHASLLQETGAVKEALDIVEEVLGSLEGRVGPDHPMVADALDVRALALMSQGAPGRAEEDLQRVLGIRRRAIVSGDHPSVARTLDRLGRVQAAAGRTNEAIASALQAEAIGRLDLALRIRSMTAAEALRYTAVRVSGLDLALTLADRISDPKDVERIWDALIRSRGLVLAEMSAAHQAALHAGQMNTLWQSFAECNSRYSNLRAGSPAGTSPEDYRRRLEDARRECEEIERKLQILRTPGQESAAESGFADVRRRLPSRTALVAYVRYRRAGETPQDIMTARPSYAAFVLPSGLDAAIAVDLGNADAIDAAVGRWRRAVQEIARTGAVTTQGEAATRAHGDALRRLVWDRVAPHIDARSEQVFVVADGALNLINLAALPSTGGDSYLVETSPPLHHIFTERTLMREPPRPDPAAGVLVVGDPLYALPAGATPANAASTRSDCLDLASVRFPPLPGAAEEARAVASLWERPASGQPTGPPAPDAAAGRVTLLTGADATEAAFKSGAAGRRVLHIATHGFFLERNCVGSAIAPAGMRGIGAVADVTEPAVTGPESQAESSWIAGLAFAGAGAGAVAGPAEENGLLLAEEVATLDLTGVEWAVLSACETAVGDARPGEGVFGLKSSFHVAGAASLIMSLWPVEDAAARAWMEALYEGRLRRNLGTAAAVHRASLNLLRARRERGESTDPFFWGGFVATGDWR